MSARLKPFGRVTIKNLLYTHEMSIKELYQPVMNIQSEAGDW